MSRLHGLLHSRISSRRGLCHAWAVACVCCPVVRWRGAAGGYARAPGAATVRVRSAFACEQPICGPPLTPARRRRLPRRCCPCQDDISAIQRPTHSPTEKEHRHPHRRDVRPLGGTLDARCAPSVSGAKPYPVGPVSRQLVHLSRATAPARRRYSAAAPAVVWSLRVPRKMHLRTAADQGGAVQCRRWRRPLKASPPRDFPR